MMEMNQWWHTFIALTMLFSFYTWGYVRASRVEHTKATIEVLAILKELGILLDYKVILEGEEEEGEDGQG